MKTIILAVSLLSMASLLLANDYRYSSDDTYVSGYTRSNGTYVAPHYRSAPNAYKWDNYSYQPSQPQFNSEPTVQHNSNWYQPNTGRFNDSNPYNNSPNYFGR